MLCFRQDSLCHFSAPTHIFILRQFNFYYFSWQVALGIFQTPGLFSLSRFHSSKELVR